MISYIVPARNHAILTTQCLTSLEYTIETLGIPSQVILIDNNSEVEEGIQPIFSAFQRKFPSTFVLKLSRDIHYTGAFALGLQHASHKNILFISNDMMITPAYVTSLLAVAALDDSYGIIRGTSPHIDLPQHKVVPPVPLRGYDDVLRFSSMVSAVNGLQHVVDLVLIGDSVLIKRQVIEKIGVFDTRFYGFFGDIDYGLRAHLAGFKLVCAKGAWLHHEGCGYVKGEAAAGGDPENLSAPSSKKMQLVHAAYKTFREKWDETLPMDYDYRLESLCLFEMAERNSRTIELYCQLDSILLQDVTYISAYSK